MSRLLAYAVALVAVLGLSGWGAWSLYHAGGKAARAEMQALVDKANAKAERDTKAAQERSDKLETTLGNQVKDLDTRLAAALARVPVVRVQKCPGRSDVPETPAHAAEHPADAGRSGHAPADGDIAPVLLRYARDAEALRLALNACKAYGAEIERFRAQIP